MKSSKQNITITEGRRAIFESELPSGSVRLYKAGPGRFLWATRKTRLDGKLIPLSQYPYSLAPELDLCNATDQAPIIAERLRRLTPQDHVREVSAAEARRLCARQALPRCLCAA